MVEIATGRPSDSPLFDFGPARPPDTVGPCRLAGRLRAHMSHHFVSREGDQQEAAGSFDERSLTRAGEPMP